MINKNLVKKENLNILFFNYISIQFIIKIFCILCIYFLCFSFNFFKVFAYENEQNNTYIKYEENFKSGILSGWSFEKNNWYYYVNGKKHTGWIEYNGGKYYLTETGKMVQCWNFIDENWYYFGYDGAMKTGWINDGNWHYLDEDGIMQTGWIEYNGEKYYLTETGKMAQCWHFINGNWYYFGYDGPMKTGWINDGNWYYLDKDGIMQTGWIEYNNEKYYLTETGKMAQYWHLNDYWYYFGYDGAMRTGWLSFDDNNQYYLNQSGIMLTNWNLIGEKWHYFRPNGLYQKNWTKEDNPGTFTTSSGEIINYKSVIKATCTAYTANKGALTSTGVQAQYGYVAVNPFDISYGTNLYICSPDGSIDYGKAVAADTGGAMLNGSVAVDLFFNTYNECIQFGIREMLIYLI